MHLHTPVSGGAYCSMSEWHFLDWTGWHFAEPPSLVFFPTLYKQGCMWRYSMGKAADVEIRE